MKSIGCHNKLGRDAEAVPRSSHAALENRSHPQLFPDNARVKMFSLERKSRTAGYNMELTNLCQRIDDLFRNTISKEFVLRIGADVNEREDRDGVASDVRSSR